MPDIAIFAVTNRTGSTLLQRIFNADPHTLVWGENGRALSRFVGIQGATLEFSRAQAKVRDRYFGVNRPMDVDISCMTPAEPLVNAAVVAAVRSYFNLLYPKQEGQRVGFKEVSHHPSAVDLFRIAFPEAQSIFLARHPVSAWKSLPAQWPVTLDEFIATWRRNVAEYPKRGKLFWFEDLVEEPETQDEIASLARLSRAELNAVLSIRVGSTAAASNRPAADYAKIMDQCGDLIPPHILDLIPVSTQEQ